MSQVSNPFIGEALSFAINNPVLILTFLAAFFAYRQLRWTRLEIAVPMWKLVKVHSIPHRSREKEEYTVHIWMENVGKGKAHNAEANLFQADVKLNELENGETKEDVIREAPESIGHNRLVNPGNLLHGQFKVKQLDKLNEVLVRVEPEDSVNDYVYIEKEKIEEGFKDNWFRIKWYTNPFNVENWIKYKLEFL